MRWWKITKNSDLQIKTKMKYLLLICLCVVATYAADEKENVGTVIGIDLGTTYSW